MALHKSLVKDISTPTVKRAVRQAIMQKPLTIYPIAASVLALILLLLSGINSLTLSLFFVSFTLAAAACLWQYFARGRLYAHNYVQACREEIELKRRATQDQVQRDMKLSGDEQGLKQISLFQDKYDNFTALLARKYEAHDLAFHRYITVAEQVFLSGLDNLESAALATRSVSAVDMDHIESALEALENDDSDEARQKIAEYRARMSLRDSQMLRASSLLLENERALTQLDRVSAKIAATDPLTAETEVELDSAMMQLQGLITRTSR